MRRRDGFGWWDGWNGWFVGWFGVEMVDGWFVGWNGCLEYWSIGCWVVGGMVADQVGFFGMVCSVCCLAIFVG